MLKSRLIRIVIVDDHPIVRAGICLVVNSQPDMRVVADFGDAQTALTFIEKEFPDVVIMDLRLPGLSGVEAIKHLNEIQPAVKSLVLTTYEGDEDIYQALKAGAAAYLIKGMSHDHLIKAIRSVSLGKNYVPGEIMKVANQRRPTDLSAREREVLALMAEGIGNVAIGNRLGISESTVKCHVTAILAHFGVKDRTQALLIALRRGYIRI